MRLALYQPDIPQNVGSLIRLAACLSVPLEVIEPCGFAFDDERLCRVAMDYYDRARVSRLLSFEALEQQRKGRLVLLTTKGAVLYTDFEFHDDDILMVGREAAGVPEEVHARADARVVIPLNPGLRSLNVATAAAIVLAEAQRQVKRAA